MASPGMTSPGMGSPGMSTPPLTSPDMASPAMGASPSPQMAPPPKLRLHSQVCHCISTFAGALPLPSHAAAGVGQAAAQAVSQAVSGANARAAGQAVSSAISSGGANAQAVSTAWTQARSLGVQCSLEFCFTSSGRAPEQLPHS